ncbi:hypothetical protein LVY74_14785 [Acinetobacter sp. ME22]|uniref:hypothetical protein n=1 Tax=Acinetobacter sp. ME22 TaxID=2904802 RepID=UPI001EDBD4D1|nr:hypothetical protein [Acinetobacter sp. ME22]MCG2574812.1 hypothetical protein [Acinetobacter sp. ME22]
MNFIPKKLTAFLYATRQEGFMVCLIFFCAALIGCFVDQQQFFPKQVNQQNFSDDVHLSYGKNYRERQLFFTQNKTVQIFKCNSFQTDVCTQNFPIRLSYMKYSTILCQRNDEKAYWNARQACINIVYELHGTTAAGHQVVIKNDQAFVQKYIQRLDIAHNILIGLFATVFVMGGLYLWFVFSIQAKRQCFGHSEV